LKPRVLICTSEFPPGPGGIGTHAHHLALQLRDHEWDVSVAAVQELAAAEDIARFNVAQPFPIRHLKQYPGAPTKLAYRFGVVSSEIRRFQPHLVVASGERMVWLAAGLRRMHGVPYVAIGHAMEFNVPARWQRGMNRYCFERADGVVCVSRFTETRMLARGIQPALRAVIPNGADDARFDLVSDDEIAAFRRRYHLQDATILITLGSVHERKGQDVVIRALPRIVSRFPDIRYVAIGTPYQRDAFTRLAAELGVEQHVHFLGILDARETVRALNAAALFVMASQHTPNGDFALCGRAAVVSDNSGVVEAIEPGETGAVAKISDPDSTADQIIELLSDRTRLERMGALARERALRDKTWKRRGVAYDGFLRRFVR
jgi:phosphatidyl-myo-inositol dimannoside synthase